MSNPQVLGDRDGVTFHAPRDRVRLNRQAQLVWDVMSRGGWYSLSVLSKLTGAPEASVSARIRDLRKPKFGGNVILRENLGGGIWAYKLVLPKGQLSLL